MIVNTETVLYGKRIKNQYEGDRADLPKWINYPAIALTTGESSKFKTRIIPLSNIVSMDSAEDSLAIARELELKFRLSNKKQKDKIIEVAGSKGNVYTVTLGKNNINNCTCPAFQFRRACKHIDKVLLI